MACCLRISQPPSSTQWPSRHSIHALLPARAQLLPKQIEGMRKKQPADVISEAGSDEEEELDVEGAPSEQHDQDIAANGGGGDARIYYDKLKADTPLQRMRKREAKARREDDPWGRVRLRQEVLGLAKLYGRGGAYESEEGAHMHVPAAHFALAKAYAEANCMQQAADHCHAAMETMDFKKTPQDKAVAWSREVYTMLAESQLTVVPPDPRAALRYVCTAAGVSVKRLEDIQDQSLRVLAAQCLTLIGMVKVWHARVGVGVGVGLGNGCGRRVRRGVVREPLDVWFVAALYEQLPASAGCAHTLSAISHPLSLTSSSPILLIRAPPSTPTLPYLTFSSVTFACPSPPLPRQSFPDLLSRFPRSSA
eukprot:366363-Chlamydomonas_euryale.AAC.9